MQRQKLWGMALKQWQHIMTVCDEIHEDQFDFHTYCMRKMTMRSYTDFLHYEDTFRGQLAAYADAAEGIVTIRLQLAKEPSLVTAYKDRAQELTAQLNAKIAEFGNDTPKDKKK